MKNALRNIQAFLCVRRILSCLPDEFLPESVLLVGVDFVFTKKIAKHFRRASVQSVDVPKQGNKPFDLIVVQNPQRDSEKEFFSLLAKDGCLIFVSDSTNEVDQSARESKFCCWDRFSTQKKIIHLFRHFGRGFVGDRLPEGYFDKQQSRINLQTVLNGFPPREIIETNGVMGLRTKIGPLFSDDFVSDTEPDASPTDRIRIISWQPLTVQKKPGWMTFGLLTDIYQKGIGIITEENKEIYFLEWAKHARRHRDRWLRDNGYDMLLVTLDEYAKAYHASKKLDWLTRSGFVGVLKYHIERHPHDVRLIGVRDKKTQQIVAGLAVIHYPDIKQSFHTTSFICDDVRHTSVGVGMIDYWYKKGIEEGIRFFNYGIVWRKGDTRAWKGYSKFKRQFNLYLIIYPKPFLKIVFPKER